MEFRILGPLEVVAGDASVAIPGIKERAVLAILLLHANELVSADRLIDELWSDEPPASAKKSLQVRITNLRKALGRESALLATQAPGYVLRLRPDQLDLHRFERLVASAEGASPAVAAERLREALALWRGEPLADLAYEGFAQGPAARLSELRLAALQKRIDGDLELGRHADLVQELEALVSEHPLREGLRGQLMLALYRSGRQADALAAYRQARRALREQVGLEPTPALQRLERAILSQHPSLELRPTTETIVDGGTLASAARRSILVSCADTTRLVSLLAVAEPLAIASARELVVVCPIEDAASLGETVAVLDVHRGELLSRGLAARVASFTSRSAADDLVRTVAEQDVDLLLVAAPPTLLDDEGLISILAGAACDVAALVGGDAVLREGPVLVPFSGTEHDWTAVELGARIAGTSRTLRLAGSEGQAAAGGRDASRIIASASLAVQGALGVAAQPLLVAPGARGLVETANDSALVIVGLPERWQSRGLGEVRRTLAVEARPPVLLVRRGLRPGVLAPPDSMTRFTWTLRAG